MHKWRLVGLLFLAAALNYADRTAMSSVFPLLGKDLRMSDVQLGATASFFLWAYAICSPLAGHIGDRLSRASLVLWSLAAWSAIVLLTGLAASSTQVLLLRALLGVAESLYMPAAVGLIAALHASAGRAKALGIHTAGYSFGMVAGGTMAGYLGGRLGWRAPLLVLGAAGLSLAAIWHRNMPEEADRQWEDAKSRVPFLAAVCALLRIRSYDALLAQSLLASIGLWILITWLPLYFLETFHLSLARAGFTGTFWMQSGSILGIFAGGVLSDRVARGGVGRRMLLHGGLYVLGAPVLVAFLRPTSLPLITAAVFLFFLCRYLGLANEQPLITELLRDDLRSTAIGLTNMCNCAAGGAGVLLAGYLKRDFGLPGLFAAISLLYVLAGAILAVAYFAFVHRDLAAITASRGTTGRESHWP